MPDLDSQNKKTGQNISLTVVKNGILVLSTILKSIIWGTVPENDRN